MIHYRVQYKHIWTNRIRNKTKIKESPLIETSFPCALFISCTITPLISSPPPCLFWVTPHARPRSRSPSDHLTLDGIRGLDPGRFEHWVPPTSLCTGASRKGKQYSSAFFPWSFWQVTSRTLAAKGRRQGYLIEQNLQPELPLFNACSGALFCSVFCSGDMRVTESSVHDPSCRDYRQTHWGSSASHS